MEPNAVVPFPLVTSEQLDRDLNEIDAAIAMVLVGAASRIRLIGLATAEEAAVPGLIRAQLAGVMFRLDRSADRAPAIIIGPLVPRSP
jgi:hypothetical protein